MFRKLTSPINIQWEVTSRCNYNCIHCYNYWRKDRSEDIDDIDVADTWDVVVSEIIECKVFDVVITGGEPLLVFDRFYPYIEKLTNGGVSVGLNSNASLVTDDISKMLKSIGVHSVFVSLPCGVSGVNDFITQTKESYSRTMNGMESLINNDVRVSVNMVITKLNLDYIRSTAEMLKNIGVSSFSIAKASTPPNCIDYSSIRLTNDEFKKMQNDIIEIQKDVGMRVSSSMVYPFCSFGSDDETFSMFSTNMCAAAKTTATVGSNGLVRPCSHASITYGHIKEGLKEVWNKMDSWRTNEYLPTECSDCKLKYWCMGGCRIEAYQQYGRFNALDPYYCGNNNTSLRNGKMPNKMVLQKDYEHSRLRINNNLRYRDEDFGGLIYHSGSMWATVKPIMYEFIKNSTTFSLSDLCNSLGVTSFDGNHVIRVLLAKNIVEEVS